MLLTQQAGTGAPPALAQVPTASVVVPTESALIAAIVAAGRGACLTTDESVAETLIALWARACEDANGPARPGDRPIVTLLTDHELLGGAHAWMDRLTPDNRPAQPGSVHEMLNVFTFGVDPATGRAARGVVHTLDPMDLCALVVKVVPA